MNSVTINGRTIVSSGSITISNGQIIIDGQSVDGLENEKTININIEGPVESLIIDNATKISVVGNVHELTSKNGNIEVTGNVTGNVENKNGNVDCGNVGGDVNTKNGNIRHR